MSSPFQAGSAPDNCSCFQMHPASWERADGIFLVMAAHRLPFVPAFRLPVPCFLAVREAWAWSPTLMHDAGTKTEKYLDLNLQALNLKLSQADCRQLEDAASKVCEAPISAEADVQAVQV